VHGVGTNVGNEQVVFGVDKEAMGFAELAVFARDNPVPEAAVSTLWSHTGSLTDLDTTDLLINLADRSLIRETYERVAAKIKPTDIYISTTVNYREDIKKQIPEIPDNNFIIEPFSGFCFENLSHLEYNSGLFILNHFVVLYNFIDRP